ncbi:ABC transporter permease [Nocardioides sp. YIM 152588]|uniref:YhgE/Pip domain-containing protein n=1 Tax=Nocardioides sp. YIM 152588 TaxID=3158259 RepID=UPI0032E4840C
MRLRPRRTSTAPSTATSTATRTDTDPASPLRSRALWLVPSLAVTLVMGCLAATYLGGLVNTDANLSGFPLAVVNDDRGATAPDGTTVDVGDQIADSLVAGLDGDEFDVEVLSAAEADERMGAGTLYGVVLLPESLSADLLGWAAAVTSPADPDAATPAPTVELATNTRAGSMAAGIASAAGQRALAEVDAAVGEQVTAQVRAQLAASGADGLSAVEAAALATPLDIEVSAYDPLPAGTGRGLSAFYYALLLVMAGFSGSIGATTLIDARLGFVPDEMGPRYRHRPHSGLSRRTTLVVKWGVMALSAALVSTVYLAVGAALGMPIDHPWVLWAFGVAMIWSIAVVVNAVNALVGNLGMTVNLFIFIVLALPSAGGTLPLEAVPPFIRWLGSFEPMHQVYVGARAILYFDAGWDAGLGRALAAAGIAAALGLVVGLVGTRAYDRRGLARVHRAVVA